ncbi:MAG: glycoside hydrolase family 3 C-terminal domain-containing protein [Oscillospiraceae bacterium]|nr:glycoside hydrolase family 3 C-terminal domain-containing protein [Oscillospiraceae bacterium]
MDEIKKLRLEEKIALCSGADAWHTKAFPEAGIPALCMSDGPHGLRKMAEGGDLTNINDSVPATCFPPAVLSACSWDPELLEQLGAAIAEEAAANGVGLLLGPGLNIKRNPLCGRNFEYFSEDPYLAGKLAAAFVRGVESRGVGACLKHFACNSQEYKRFNSDSVMDERTLREIYLSAFELAVREGKPSAVMCAYNKLNGEHCSDSRRLLTDILRNEWGFDGMVVADWGAMNDRILAFRAGCDLNMPGGSAYQEREAARAVREGSLPEADVDRSAERILRLAKRAQKVQTERPAFDAGAHHELARRAAAESAVLLKNDRRLLPIDPKTDVLLIGPMAEKLRIQGGGSSHIRPLRQTSLTALCPDLPYKPGCLPDGSADAGLRKEAVAAAKKAGIPVILAGLPDSLESEGFDRASMAMPRGYCELIEAVAAVNPHTVVVLIGGSPMELPWADRVKSILYLGLPGEAGAEAIRDLLFGDACPGGRLAESWPYRLDDCVSASYYAGENRDAHYREGIYVGYRCYQKAGVPVRYPFGYGLSYTDFACSALKVEGDRVSCRVKNTGRRDGSLVLQLYVLPPEGCGYRPVRELKGFRKLFLRRGESAEVSFELNDRAFAVWQDGWRVPGGDYTIQLAASADSPLLTGTIRREGPAWTEPLLPVWYRRPKGAPGHIDFEHLVGRPVTVKQERKGSYTMDSTIEEMREDSLIARMIYAYLARTVAVRAGEKGSAEYRMALSTAADAPIRSMKIFLGKESGLPDALLDLINGKTLSGLHALLAELKNREI